MLHSKLSNWQLCRINFQMLGSPELHAGRLAVLHPETGQLVLLTGHPGLRLQSRYDVTRLDPGLLESAVNCLEKHDDEDQDPSECPECSDDQEMDQETCEPSFNCLADQYRIYRLGSGLEVRIEDVITVQQQPGLHVVTQLDGTIHYIPFGPGTDTCLEVGPQE